MTETIKIDMSSTLAIGCMVCGESVSLTAIEEYRVLSGGVLYPKMCDECKRAIEWAKTQKRMVKRI